MNLVQFSDDYSRSTATNMFWYRDTAKGGAEMDEFVENLVSAKKGDGSVEDDATDIKGAELKRTTAIA